MGRSDHVPSETPCLRIDRIEAVCLRGAPTWAPLSVVSGEDVLHDGADDLAQTAYTCPHRRSYTALPPPTVYRQEATWPSR